MPEVWIPSLMRSLTGGKEQISIEGDTLRQIIENLEALHPGVKGRVMEDDRIRPGLAVAVDGVITEDGLRTVISAESEVHFVTAISGG